MRSSTSASTPARERHLLAHADDKGPIAPVLARYAREGVQIHMVVVSNADAGPDNVGRFPVPTLR